LDCETDIVVRPVNVRARRTNSPRGLPVGVDGRSAEARRWRDILEALIVSYGQDDMDKLRSLATLRVSLEVTQAAVLRGDVLRSEDIVRLERLIGQREKELGLRARARLATAPRSLAEYIAAKGSVAGRGSPVAGEDEAGARVVPQKVGGP
jgi:hypothetical protein